MPRIVLGVWLLQLLGSRVCVPLLFSNLDLSEDATVRVLSLIESGGIGDYEEDRGLTALNSLEIAMENPVTGAGVGTISEMPEGPHNMFLAMMVEYGLVGPYCISRHDRQIGTNCPPRRPSFIGNGSVFRGLARHLRLRLAQSPG